jgi:signal transduction histidine kinase
MTPRSPALRPAVDETDWINGELVKRLMHTAYGSRIWGVTPIPVMVGVFWGYGNGLGVVLWALFATAVCAARFWIFHRYRRHIMRRDATTQVAFHERYGWIWPAGALVWGLSPLLFVERASLPNQFIGWLVFAVLGMLAVNTFAAQLRTARLYITVLVIVPVLSLCWMVSMEWDFEGPNEHYWFIILLLMFWQVLLGAARRTHMTLRKNYELQYRNLRLIESLTRQTQAALDAVEIKNRFLASATHDLRQPVHALALYADWLRGEPDLVREIAPKIVEATKAVNALFDSLFDFARLDSGQTKLNIGPVNLSTLMHDLEVQYRPLAQAKGLDFRMHLRAGVVHSDPILLQRIVGNLISNAIKYTLKGGVLVAIRESARGAFRVEIWDTGVGIAPQHQQAIFREFYKIPTHSGTEDGFGLGLYIVSRLAHILGHPISLSSRLGRGTRFRLVLARADTDQAAQRVAEAAGAQLDSMP